jgi:hypothetical protein
MKFGTWNVRSLYRAGSLTAAARDLLLTHHCAGDKIDKNEMGGACSAYGGAERRVQGFGGKILKERDH